MKSDKNNGEIESSFIHIDRIVHEPARLTILSYLYVVTEADFIFLERQTGLTRGNLSSHLRKLEEAGYVGIKKEFIEKIPRTVLKLTTKGRKAFDNYCRMMQKALENRFKADDYKY